MQLNTCRLCKDEEMRPLLRYGVRHYCHAECGFAKWGNDFLNKIPAHEIGHISYRNFIGQPERVAIARKLCPLLSDSLEGLIKNFETERSRDAAR